MQEKLLNLVRDNFALSKQDVANYFSNNNKFNDGFIINMPSRKERLEKAIKNLHKVKLSYQIFTALNGKELMKSTTMSMRELIAKFSILRPGEFGCLLSHLSILALASKHPNPNNYTIVFEDDIITNGCDMEKLYKEISEISDNEDVGLIYFGKCFEKCGMMTNIKDNIYRAVAPSCCHAYAIKNSFASRVFKDMDMNSFGPDYFNRGIDSILGDYIINNFTSALVMHPAIFYQDVLDGGSDLRPEFMQNYQECNDTHQNNNSSVNVAAWVYVIMVILAVIVAFFIVRAMGLKWYHMLGFIIFLVIVAVVIWATFSLVNNNASSITGTNSQDKPTHETRVQLPALIKMCNTNAKSLTTDKTALANKSFKIFNPSGLIKDSNGNYVTSHRCAGPKASYPILHVYDKTLSKLISAKKISLTSPISKVNLNTPLGYEDMRLFQSPNGEFGLIGVNLDRNEYKLPSMVLARLDANFNQIDLVHLKYKPLEKVSNKNWMPIHFNSSNSIDLNFIVSIDPLLIVKADKVGECHKVFESDKVLDVDNIRNSTIPIHIKDIPSGFRIQFNSIFKTDAFNHIDRDIYLMIGHKKVFVDKSICYKNYFVMLDLHKGTDRSVPALGSNATTQERSIGSFVKISKPFSIETEINPHVEYISGLNFLNSKMIVMYGLEDKESKCVEISSEQFEGFNL